MQYINNDNINNNSLTMKQIDNLLDNERLLNNKSTWNKLDKSTKISKLKIFSSNYDCTNDDKKKLFDILFKALDQNKLQKIKDVVYDVDKQEIISIPTLTFTNNKFIVKNEKRISTSKSLPIKNKVHSTKKNKYKIDNKDIK